MSIAITADNFGASAGTQTVARLYKLYVLLGVRVPNALKVSGSNPDYRITPWTLMTTCDPEESNVDYGALTSLQQSVPLQYARAYFKQMQILLNKK